MKQLIKGNGWTPANMKKVLGKFIRIGYVDTSETVMGVAYKRSSMSISIVDAKGLSHCVDSPSQVQAISHKRIDKYVAI